MRIRDDSSGGDPVKMSPRETVTAVSAFLFTLLGVGIQLIPGMKFLGQLCLCAAAGVILWHVLCVWAERSGTGRLWKRIFLGCFTAGCVLFASLEITLLTQGREDCSALPADAVIVLGAGVNGSTPSLALQTRIDAAAAYLEAHPDVPAVLSGGQGSDEEISEASAMYTALTEQGIDPARLMIEDQSTSTAENFIYSKECLDALGIDAESASIAVVTNDFHIFRAKLIAQRQGVQMLGIPVSLPYGWLTANYYIREAFALVKTALLDR